jgi:soluble lytic murein transglycosylase-like protein
MKFPAACYIAVAVSLTGVCEAVAFEPTSSPPSRSAVKALVIEEAGRSNVPVALALAMAHVESAFDSRARSYAGARGVMQIMPETALTEYGIGADLLWHPRVNIRLGLHFMDRLIKQYRGRVDLALSHYNGGSAVGKWPKSRVIPATRSYVNNVQRLQRFYRDQLQGR